MPEIAPTISDEDMFRNRNLFTIVRIRPLLHNELERRCQSNIIVEESTTCTNKFSPCLTEHDKAVQCLGDAESRKYRFPTMLQWTPTRTSMEPKQFEFDRVFPPPSTQLDIFSILKKPIQDTLLGQNLTMVAFGQCGSGKSYTMLGSPQSMYKNHTVGGLRNCDGVISRTMYDLIALRDTIHSQEEENKLISLSMSYIEIHNDKVRDLLSKEGTILALRDRGKDGIELPGKQVRQIESIEHAHQLLQEAKLRRSTRHRKGNYDSSMSHVICTITTIIQDVSDPQHAQKGRITMVDLPSTEDVKHSGVTGRQRQEATRNNKDLLSLGRVLMSLSSPRQHIPFRDSKLTRLLRDSLGENCRTILISCVSPNHEEVAGSLITLEYAAKARLKIRQTGCSRDQHIDNISPRTPANSRDNRHDDDGFVFSSWTKLPKAHLENINLSVCLEKASYSVQQSKVNSKTASRSSGTARGCPRGEKRSQKPISSCTLGTKSPEGRKLGHNTDSLSVVLVNNEGNTEHTSTPKRIGIETNDGPIAECVSEKALDMVGSVGGSTVTTLPESEGDNTSPPTDETPRDQNRPDIGQCQCTESSIGVGELADFYLPKLMQSCVCGGTELIISKWDNPLDLENILQDWQVDFLRCNGISDLVTFVCSYKDEGGNLAEKLCLMQKRKGMKQIRTSMCRIALHIWNRTCMVGLKSIIFQQVGGATRIEAPEILRITRKDRDLLTSKITSKP